MLDFVLHKNKIKNALQHLVERFCFVINLCFFLLKVLTRVGVDVII